MLRDHPMQCATCTKWAHDAEQCCMVCELHHSGVLQGGLQAVQQRVYCLPVCVLPASCWKQACYTGPPDIVLGCSNVWHMCTLHEQPQRTDQTLCRTSSQAECAGALRTWDSGGHNDRFAAVHWAGQAAHQLTVDLGHLA